jgi:vesicle coat complex subunit
LAVNTFVKDTQDPNPLIRALAVRTMGCIRVDKIVEYLCEPLRKCLKDEDPYVRKTAAVCVAKMYDINGELVRRVLFSSSPCLMAPPVPPTFTGAATAWKGPIAHSPHTLLP